jgi:HAD superfamily hydrolase (TIGR01549 family)
MALGPKDVILFDMGYTLIYFEPPTEIIVQESLRAIGAERTLNEIGEAIQEVWGDYYRDAATATFPATQEYDRESQAALSRRLLAHLGLPDHKDTLSVYHEAIESRFSRPGTLRSYPEVLSVLESLKTQGYRLGIISNWSWNLRERVAGVGLTHFFEIVWASAYAGCNKPHPSIFHQALDQIKVPVERALYVGDSYEHDVVGAQSAGLDVVLLDRSGSLGEADCTTIRDLHDLLKLVST